MISFKQYQKQICETANAGLAAKASKSGVSIGTLRKVYNRGMAAWNSGHRPGTTPQQWGMARVNSYISKGSGTYGGADKDLHEEDLSEKEWSSKYKSSIDCSNPKGFSQKAHCDSLKLKEGDTSKLPRIDHDKETGLPKKYVAGLSKTTAKARAAHFAAADKLSDSNPAAYTPAPGDATAKTKESKYTKKYREMFGEDMDEEIYEACWDTHKQVGMKKKGNKMVPDCVPKGVAEGLSQTLRKVVPGYAKREIDKKMDDQKFGRTNVDKDANYYRYKKIQDKLLKKSVKEELTDDEQFDIIEEMVMAMAAEYNADPESIWEKFETIDDITLLEAAVDAKGYKSSTGGLTQKGRDAYNAKGANLKAPVTTAPSKLKAGSKAANRRKSFCARMGGMQGAMKKPNGEPTRKALALRKWNC